MDQFQLREKDAAQLKQYSVNIKKEWPDATIEQYLIYCFGNKGFRVFKL